MAYDPAVIAAIRRFSARYGVDPNAVRSIGAVEGGNRRGAVGDHGTSYGPFQLHVGGALPRGRNAAWAGSDAGIEYAIRQMAIHGARGLHGQAAVAAISRNFERPADPATEIRRAMSLYGTSGGFMASQGPREHTNAAFTPQPGSASGNKTALLSYLMGNLQSYANTGVASNPMGLSELMAPQAPQVAPNVKERSLSPAAASVGKQAAHGLVGVPTGFATRPGVQLNSQWLSEAERLDRQFGVRINSGYRSPARNRAVGGARHSDHLSGNAVDFTGSPAAMRALYKYAQKRGYPYVEPWGQAGGSHVHISFAR